MPVADYRVPYIQDSLSHRRPRRRLACHAVPLSGGSYYEESEQPDDFAIVRLRAPEAEHANWRLVWPVIKDVQHIWTPERVEARPVGAEVVLIGPKVPTKTLDQLADDVLNESRWGEVQRLADTLMRRADRDGYCRLTGMEWKDAAKVINECSRRGYDLSRVSTGTFPTTSIIDSGTGADANPAGGIFTALGSYSALQRISNSLSSPGAGTTSGSFDNVSTFGADSEVYMTLSTIGANGTDFDVMLRIKDQTANWDGYAIEAAIGAGTDTIAIYRVDDKVYTQLGATINQNNANGNKAGLEAIGSNITYYFNTSGTWSSLGTRVEGTYTLAGYIGWFCDSNAFRLKDLGGGTVVSATKAIPRPRRSQRFYQRVR